MGIANKKMANLMLPFVKSCSSPLSEDLIRAIIFLDFEVFNLIVVVKILLKSRLQSSNY